MCLLKRYVYRFIKFSGFVILIVRVIFFVFFVDFFLFYKRYLFRRGFGKKDVSLRGFLGSIRVGYSSDGG